MTFTHPPTCRGGRQCHHAWAERVCPAVSQGPGAAAWGAKTRAEGPTALLGHPPPRAELGSLTAEGLQSASSAGGSETTGKQPLLGKI